MIDIARKYVSRRQVARIFGASVVFLLFFSALASADQVLKVVPGKYTIDESHTQVMFTIRHLGISKVTGNFGSFQGDINIPEAKLSSLETQGTISVSSIDTSNEKRDNHLRSSDFFNVDKYKNITFRSSDVKKVNGDKFGLLGELTINGVSKKVILQATYLGFAKDPWGKERVAFEAETKINRKDFGLTWNKVLETGGLVVGEDVQIRLEIEAIKNP